MKELLNSRYGGLAVLGITMVGGLIVTEYFNSANKAMEHGYDAELTVNNYGSVTFKKKSEPAAQDPLDLF